MATRLYLHDAASSISGTLPSTEQSTKTAVFNFEAQTNNRSMSTTIGTTQASKTFVNTTTRAANNTCYVTKFISPGLNQTSIAANTWTWNFACKNSNTTPCDDYPVPDTGTTVPICVYVWRPSTGAKVSNIFDGNTATGYFDTGNQNISGKTTSEVAEHGTFSGSSVTCAVGDVIVVEAWISVWFSSSTSCTLSFFYDGTSTNTTSGTVVSNHAAFLETPENITFQGTQQNINKSLTETVTIGATTPTKLKGSKRTGSDTITINTPAPTRLTTKNRANTETVSISTAAGYPAFVKAHNTNKALTETVTVGATTPTFTRNKVRSLTSTVTINTPAPTYVQVPKRARVSLTETVTINSTVTKKSSKKRTLLN